MSVAVGDVDSDGDLDLVRGNWNEPTTLYLNIGGEASFDTVKAWSSDGAPTSSVALGDIDSDGDLDLVCGNVGEPNTLYLNLGGTFAHEPSPIGPSETTTRIVFGDVDNDGDLDLVCGTQTAIKIYPNIYSNNHDAYFADAPSWTIASGWVKGLALGDVDGDGDLDLVTGKITGGVTLRMNTQGNFSTLSWTGQVEDVACVTLGDVDSDSDLDLVVGTAEHGARLFLNMGGTFDSAPIWVGPDERTVSVAFGDVDGDGDLDLVCGNQNQAATLYDNTGSPRIFEPTPACFPVENTTDVALVDVDGDHDLDLVRCNDRQPATLYRNELNIFNIDPYWQNRGSYSLYPTFVDLDRDGDLDLVHGERELNEDGRVTLRLNQNGDFPLTWSDSANVLDIALGDVNDDEFLDLVIAHGHSDYRTSLYLNEDGAFSAEPAWTDSNGAYAVALGDVSGDGRADLVVGVWSGRAKLYLNQGNGFGPMAPWSNPPELTYVVALGDVDNDGDLDLVRGNYNQRSTLYLNTGGTFASAPVWYGVKANTKHVRLVDVNGDGRLDLLQANDGQHGSMLYLNKGTPGVYGSGPDWTGRPEDSQSVDSGDLDGDGDLDLLFGRYTFPASVYLSRGGQFAVDPTWVFPEGIDQIQMLGSSVGLLVDFDDDGDLDLYRGSCCAIVGGRHPGPKLHPRKSPWLVARTQPMRQISPARHLANNPAHLRQVRAAGVDANTYRIAFLAVDVESDPMWIVGEYQFEGAPLWFPMQLNGYQLRAGPFTTSETGIQQELTWDVSGLPLDRRNVVIRLRALSPPQRAGVIQFIPDYLHTVGQVKPMRPVIAVSPGTLDFSTVTVGDSASVDLIISNTGNQELHVNEIESPASEVLVQAVSQFVVPAGESRTIPVVFAPREVSSAIGPLRIHSNDPSDGLLEISLVTEVLALEVSSQLLGPPELPLGEAVTVVVTPEHQVHVERGAVHYRIRGAAAFADSSALGARESESDFIALIPGISVTEAGIEYYIQVENSGVFATDPPGAPDSLFSHDVAPPVTVTASAVPDLNGEYPIGRATLIVASLQQGTQFDNGRLYYRSGGQADYDSLDLVWREATPGSFAPAALVPGDSIDARGLEYWVRVQTPNTTLTDPPQDAAAQPHTLRTHVAHLAEDQQHPAGHYRLVSVPLDLSLPEDATLEAILSDQAEFGPYDPRRWRSFRWLSGEYVELPQAASSGGRMRPTPGRSFWLIADARNRIDTAPVAGRSTPTGTPQHTALEPGWNQIGNPFLFPLAWQQVWAEGAQGTLALEPPVAWDEIEEKYRDEDVVVLQPFEGYWVHNPTNATLDLWFPADETDLGPMRTRAQRPTGPDEWRLQIVATCGTTRDSRNFLGTAATAQDDFDAIDRADPPLVPGSGLSLYFLDPDQDGRMPRTVDMRPPLDDESDPAQRGHVWLFEIVRSGQESEPLEVELEFRDLEQVPTEFEVRLVDRTLEQKSDLRLQPRQTFLSGNRTYVQRAADARFVLLIGTPEFVEEAATNQASGPRSTRLLATSPNPVGASTVIRFETARPGRVSLTVFDVAGHRVRTLTDREHNVGRHEIAWRGDDHLGHRVAPGVYFLRLVAPDRTDTRKIVKAR